MTHTGYPRLAWKFIACGRGQPRTGDTPVSASWMLDYRSGIYRQALNLEFINCHVIVSQCL